MGNLPLQCHNVKHCVLLALIFLVSTSRSRSGFLERSALTSRVGRLRGLACPALLQLL